MKFFVKFFLIKMTIEIFWKNNSKYWFNSSKDFDTYIYNTFVIYTLTDETIYG